MGGQTRQPERQMKVMGAETDRRMKATDRKIGELGNRFGELAEHLIMPNITVPEGFRPRVW